MARVELSEGAAEDLERLIVTHSLPSDTNDRLKRTLRPLGRFPRLGAEIGERRPGYRFVLGPWPWLVIVYVDLEVDERVIVLSIEDGRSSRATTSQR